MLRFLPWRDLRQVPMPKVSFYQMYFLRKDQCLLFRTLCFGNKWSFLWTQKRSILVAMTLKMSLQIRELKKEAGVLRQQSLWWAFAVSCCRLYCFRHLSPHTSLLSWQITFFAIKSFANFSKWIRVNNNELQPLYQLIIISSLACIFCKPSSAS